MQAFTYRSDVLHAEEVPVRELAQRFGTPLYVYSRNHLRERYRAIASAMAAVKPLICYSIKANSNAAVIRTLAAEGAGFDIVSGGELFRALRAGADASKIVFAGVGKTREEIEYALTQQIRFFTCESEPEARRISECAKHLGLKGRIAFRVNPDVDPKTHKYISTGKKENKFGLDFDRTMKAYEMAATLPNIEIAGLRQTKARLNGEFVRAVDLIVKSLANKGKVIVTGVGKSGNLDQTYEISRAAEPSWVEVATHPPIPSATAGRLPG